MSPVLCAAFALGAALLASLPATARAADADAHGVELALRTGYGSPMSPGSTANPYELGGGGRAGYAGHHLYAGLYLDRWLGGSGYLGAIRNTDSAWTGGADACLNAVIAGVVTVRPAIGLGAVTTSVTTNESPPYTQSFSTFYVEPSLTFLASWRSFFVGFDIGWMVSSRSRSSTVPPSAATSSPRCSTGAWCSSRSERSSGRDRSPTRRGGAAKARCQALSLDAVAESCR